jgi:hypothetical protein
MQFALKRPPNEQGCDIRDALLHQCECMEKSLVVLLGAKTPDEADDWPACQVRHVDVPNSSRSDCGASIEELTIDRVVDDADPARSHVAVIR